MVKAQKSSYIHGSSLSYAALEDFVHLGGPDFVPEMDLDVLYHDLYEQIYLQILRMVYILPLILPDPQKVTLFEIVQFTFFDEADLIFLQDLLQDLTT